jgi:hypothetical protein
VGVGASASPEVWFGCGLGVVWVWFGCGLGLVWVWFGSGLSPDVGWGQARGRGGVGVGAGQGLVRPKEVENINDLG